MASNRIPVYLAPTKVQPSLPSSPPHRTSPSFASLLIRINWAKQLKDGDLKAGIMLCRRDTWAEIKSCFRDASTRPIHRILPPRQPETLLLSYPPKNYESGGRQKQADLWLNATRF